MEFKQELSAQITAALLYCSPKRELNKNKLLSLIYLVDRKSIELYGCPITYDNYFSNINIGPVNAQIYNLLHGEVHPSECEKWLYYITDETNFKVGLTHNTKDIKDLNLLSSDDLKCIDIIWQQFKNKKTWSLINYLKSLSEYEEYNYKPILFKNIVYSIKNEEAETIIKFYNDTSSIN